MLWAKLYRNGSLLSSNWKVKETVLVLSYNSQNDFRLVQKELVGIFTIGCMKFLSSNLCYGVRTGYSTRLGVFQTAHLIRAVHHSKHNHLLHPLLTEHGWKLILLVWPQKEK